MLASRGQPALRLSVPEVLTAVRSLYANELKPFGRVVLKRLREQAAESIAAARGLPAEAIDPETMPKIDPKRLRRLCQACPQLCVSAEDGREFSVTLAGQPCCFLDVCSPHDPYRPELWADVVSYFQSLSGEEMYLPSGRYASARLLLRRRLPFLEGCSLGQVCHIVQLAISQKRILGRLDDQLVPYWFSEERVKDQCAFHQQPLDVRPLRVATFEEVQQCLRELLGSEVEPQAGVLTLSNLKRLFRVHFQLELSETALGYSRMFDLLHDERLRDVCLVEAHRNGQLLVKRGAGPCQVPCHQLALQPVASPEMTLAEFGAGCFVVAPDQQQQIDMHMMWNTVCLGSVVYPTQAMQANSFPPSLTALRNVQVDLGMDSRWYGQTHHASPQDFDQSQGNVRQQCGTFVCGDVKGHDEDSDHSTDLPNMPDSSAASSDDGERPCLLSALAMQAEELRAEEEESTRPSLRSRAAPQVDHVVKNTFIDIPRPPAAGAKRRLRSVPKDLGSQLLKDSGRSSLFQVA